MYVFLGDAADVLYVGKAANLRSRLRQHAAAGPPTSHLHRRYELVREVRWELAPSEEAADVSKPKVRAAPWVPDGDEEWFGVPLRPGARTSPVAGARLWLFPAPARA